MYLGYKIDKYGIHLLTEKVEAVKNAPEPKNITQLKSYLELANSKAVGEPTAVKFL